MKKNILNIALALTLGLGATSCNDWLDVQPAEQVEDTALFENESGYKEALAGVYSSMVSDRTYSKELLFGAIGVLGHEWDNMPYSTYDALSSYDYEASASENLISGIWSGNYNAIANANNIIKKIDGESKKFTGKNYNIIKGEAYALRAFLHFNLLRMFGVSYAVDKNMPAIPYVTDLTYDVFPQLTVEQVAAKVLEDLQTAESLLQEDPIKTGEEITDLIDNGYLKNRNMHLNYYAVKALEARLYMWTQQYDKALAAANEVILSEKFPWKSGDDFVNARNYMGVEELIFGLNNVNMSTMTENFFNPDNTSISFSIDTETRLEYFDNVTGDYRYIDLFINGTRTESVNRWYYRKYYINDDDVSDASAVLPTIRISEMYLIKAECNYRASGKGLEELNEIRTHRNSEILTVMPSDFYEELLREYRREFLGEGQLWFFYKRLNIEKIKGSDADPIGQKVYTFPIPKSEKEQAERKDNK